MMIIIFHFCPMWPKIVEKNVREGIDVGWHGRIPLFSMDWRDCFADRILRGRVASSPLRV